MKKIITVIKLIYILYISFKRDTFQCVLTEQKMEHSEFVNLLLFLSVMQIKHGCFLFHLGPEAQQLQGVKQQGENMLWLTV